MPNQIARDIYVLSNKVKEPIDYVRFTNAIPIVFNFQDYDIPEGSTVNAYCAKPSGAAVYTPAKLSGNTVTITVTDQMFIELGVTILQVQIVNGDSTLVTFGWPVNVQPNGTEGDIPPSKNESGFWNQLQQQVTDAVNNCNEATENANTATESAEQATQAANLAAANANEAAENVGESVQGAVSDYFEENPIRLDDPVLEGTTLKFIIATTPSLDDTTLKFIAGSSPSATLEQDVADLKTFAIQFDDKTLYTT